MSEEDDDACFCTLGGRDQRLVLAGDLVMKGSVYPRPAKRVIDTKTGKSRLAPVRKGETYTDARGRVRVATADSTWAYQFTRGSKTAGNRRHHKKGGFRTRKECEAALAEALSKVGQGDLRVLVRPSTQMLRTYTQSWIDSRRSDLKPSTLVGYQAVIDAWISRTSATARCPRSRLNCSFRSMAGYGSAAAGGRSRVRRGGRSAPAPCCPPM
jgi:hypothetical protein